MGAWWGLGGGLVGFGGSAQNVPRRRFKIAITHITLSQLDVLYIKLCVNVRRYSVQFWDQLYVKK